VAHYEPLDTPLNRIHDIIPSGENPLDKISPEQNSLPWDIIIAMAMVYDIEVGPNCSENVNILINGVKRSRSSKNQSVPLNFYHT